MNTIEKSADYLSKGFKVAQGDVTLKAVDSIPELPEQKPEDGKYILAHSETGHHHAVMAQPGLKVFDQDEFFSYVDNQTDNVIELKHYRGFDTHKPIGIPPGKYKITRQREYTPEGFRRAAD